MVTSKEKFIVITGATRGLGRALVSEFVAQGHVVAGCGRSTAGVAELRAAFSSPHAFAEVDVADGGEVASWARSVVSGGRVPDLLINNAALMNDPAPLWEVPREQFDALVDVNIKGVANVLRAFVPAMVAAGRGVVVNLSSGWGRSVSAEVAPYCATKWAIEGLSKAVAEEVPRGMAVVPLNPGVIDTDMLRRCWGESAGNYQSPERWARAAAPFLLGLGPRDNGRSLTVPGIETD
ncbi:SDR family NAD(P)-dependent oxidoreductase [Opitutales bacterium ASA1]|uniref:SDR family oxidoreductase n=1 Tax=Congregicoccus parvus TaxID=3081749 RepID=UPI002B2CA5E8|nr:SDR family NAD(P)-dependent oxidoreductase [Opitutales bacterium ASA1]